MKFVSSCDCPICGEHPLHISRRGGSFKFLWGVLGFSYYRCWRCGALLIGRRNIPGIAPARTFSRDRHH